MRKKIWFFGAALSILLSLIPIAVQANPSVLITNYSLSPAVFFPGDEGTLQLTITNAELANTVTSTTTAGGTTMVVTDTVGATLNSIWIESAYDNDKAIRASETYYDVGDLAPGASIVISFEIKVDDGIGEGVYYPIACVDVDTFEDIRYPFEVKVSRDSVDLIPKNVPQTISRCGATDISFMVMNTRENMVTNVCVTPQDVDGVDVRPKTMVVDQLSSGSCAEVSFSLVPDKIGLFDIIFDINYANGRNDHSTEYSIFFEVVDSLDVAPIIHSMPSEIALGEKKSVQLKIFNAKSEKISSVLITPISSVHVTPSQYFIGSMDSDDIYSVSFDIDTTELLVNESYEIGFVVSFKQDGSSYETPAVMTSFTVTNQTANGDQMAISLSIVFVFLCIGGFFVYRWRKKNQLKRLITKQQ